MNVGYYERYWNWIVGADPSKILSETLRNEGRNEGTKEGRVGPGSRPRSIDHGEQDRDHHAADGEQRDAVDQTCPFGLRLWVDQGFGV